MKKHAKPAGSAPAIVIEADTSGSFAANLQKLIKSKEPMIRKALNVDRDPLDISVGNSEVTFAWWDAPFGADEAVAYMSFLAALCSYAGSVKAVRSSSREVQNEKYAFRSFLIRLGFVGSEYQKIRQVLLRRLSGNAAYSNWKKAEVVTPETGRR